MLKPETNPRAVPTLSKPLKRGDSLVFRDHRKVKADDVIGKPYRSVVAGGRRALFRIYEPTLGQYCDNAPRVVTPVGSFVRKFMMPWLILIDLFLRCKLDCFFTGS